MNRLDDYGEILTVREVTKVLGIARNSVYQAAATGQIPSVRVAGASCLPGDRWSSGCRQALKTQACPGTK